MKKFLFAILAAALMSGGCSTKNPADNGLKIEDIAGKWSVYEIYNLYFTDSWDNIEKDLGLDYMYAVFNSNYTYTGKFNKDMFSGTFIIEGWNIEAETTESGNSDPGGDNTNITYAVSDMKQEEGIMTATMDITFGGAKDGTMTVRVKKTE